MEPLFKQLSSFKDGSYALIKQRKNSIQTLDPYYPQGAESVHMQFSLTPEPRTDKVTESSIH